MSPHNATTERHAEGGARHGEFLLRGLHPGRSLFAVVHNHNRSQHMPFVLTHFALFLIEWEKVILATTTFLSQFVETPTGLKYVLLPLIVATEKSYYIQMCTQICVVHTYAQAHKIHAKNIIIIIIGSSGRFSVFVSERHKNFNKTKPYLGSICHERNFGKVQ